MKRIKVAAILCSLAFSSFVMAKDPQWSDARWKKFETAIQKVETGGEKNPDLAVGDSGKSVGRFQIQKACWQDAVQYDPSIGGKYEDCKNPEYASKILREYVKRYLHEGGDEIDAARLWNSGPSYAKKKEKTEGYVKKFLNFFKKKEGIE